MPAKSPSSKGAKKGMSYTLSSRLSSSPIRKRQRRIQPAILEQVNSSPQGTSKTESSAPKIKTEMSSPTHSSVANGDNEKSSASSTNNTANGNGNNAKSEFAGLSLFLNQFPCSQDDMTLDPCPNSGPNPTFSSQNGRWEWMFLPSNTGIESSPPKATVEDMPEANPNMQRSDSPLSTIDLDAFLFPFHILENDDDHPPVPSIVDDVAGQAKTVKHVKFFMDTTHDKHFVPIEVTHLIGHANWEQWLSSMRLLFRQHSVWSVVTSEIQPLPPSHNLYLWYERMCDCAIGLIYANVSEEIRKSACFINIACDDDPEVLISHLYVHYSSPDSDDVHSEDELD